MVMNPTTPTSPHLQGEFVSPVRGVVNCYDMDDFARAAVRPGTTLIRNIQVAGTQAPRPPALHAGFVTWNRIRIEAPAHTLEAAPVDLVFFDAVSDLGMRVSLRAVPVVAGAMLAFGLVSVVPRRRALASPAA
jgi:hypothetical protein